MSRHLVSVNKDAIRIDILSSHVTSYTLNPKPVRDQDVSRSSRHQFYYNHFALLCRKIVTYTLLQIDCCCIAIDLSAFH